MKDLLRGQTLAFHSYKGGTGKTTLSSNIAAALAVNGLRVCLLDFDFYAPSLATYFSKKPEYFLNELLRGEADFSEILVDLSSELELNGKLFVGFSNPRREHIQEIEIQDHKWQLQALRRFLIAQKELVLNYNLDYIILDTSPGIRYWSINAIGASDLLFLISKINDMDILGTKKMIQDTYDSLTKFGSKKFLILNKIPGFSPIVEFQAKKDEIKVWENEIEKKLNTQAIGSIPCFCDVQFNKHEFLSVLRNSDHPFSKKVIDIANKLKEIK